MEFDYGRALLLRNRGHLNFSPQKRIAALSPRQPGFELGAPLDLVGAISRRTGRIMLTSDRIMLSCLVACPFLVALPLIIAGRE